jgi:hypothetical protein
MIIKSNKFLVILGLIMLSLFIVSSPALAYDSDTDGDVDCNENGKIDGPDDVDCDGDGDDSGVFLCTDATDTANTISTVFTIFSVLGPVFGSLFFIGMTVADTAKMSGDYQKERKRVLLYGFSVPVSIAFLEVIGSQLVASNIDCFFPNV